LGIWVQTINLIVIICLSPVENSERKLEEDEKKKYGIRTKVIAICLYSLYCILYSLGNVYMLAPVAVACLVVGILLIAGHIKYGKARMLVGWFI